MKRTEIDYFTTMSTTGYGYKLADNADTLEEMKAKIDGANARAKERGYKSEQWIITHVEEYRYWNDAGMFQKSERIEQAVCIYPSKL